MSGRVSACRQGGQEADRDHRIGAADAKSDNPINDAGEHTLPSLTKRTGAIAILHEAVARGRLCWLACATAFLDMTRRIRRASGNRAEFRRLEPVAGSEASRHARRTRP